MAPGESILTPNDLRQASGLTPRQINDWDSRGALPSDRDGERGHRKFTPLQVFAIAVTAAFKREFGVPVEKSESVRNWLLEDNEADDGSDALNYAAHLMAERGLGVWLCTDFADTTLILTEMDSADLWAAGFFDAGQEHSFAFLLLNPIVNRILVGIGRSPIEPHQRYRDLVTAMREDDRAHHTGERELLAMIRSGKYRTVEVTTPDGEIHTITSTEFLKPGINPRAVLDTEDNQKLTANKVRGKIVGYTQKVTTKPGPTGADARHRDADHAPGE